MSLFSWLHKKQALVTLAATLIGSHAYAYHQKKEHPALHSTAILAERGRQATEAELAAQEAQQKLAKGIHSDRDWQEFCALIRHAKAHADSAHAEDTQVLAGLAGCEAIDTWIINLTSISQKLQNNGYSSYEAVNTELQEAYVQYRIVESALAVLCNYREERQIRAYMRLQVKSFVAACRDHAGPPLEGEDVVADADRQGKRDTLYRAFKEIAAYL